MERIFSSYFSFVFRNWGERREYIRSLLIMREFIVIIGYWGEIIYFLNKNVIVFYLFCSVKGVEENKNEGLENIFFLDRTIFEIVEWVYFF